MKIVNPKLYRYHYGSKSLMRIIFFTLIGLFIVLPVAAQKRNITGTVNDASGDPMIGVSVVLKGTSVGTITDFNGNYSIETSSNKDVLIFSYVGYETKTLQVGSGNVMNVTLREDTKRLKNLL